MKKKLGALVLATAMTASLTVPAFAAYEYIENLELSIDYDIEAGSDEWSFDVDVKNSHVEFDPDEDVTFTNAPEEGEAWEDGVKPKVTIVLRVDKDYDWRFKDIDKADVTLTEGSDKATISSVSDTSSKVTVKLTLPKLEYPDGYWDTRLEIEDAYWDDEDGIAYWNENADAESYELRVYRGTTSLAGTIKTTETEYNLSEYFTRKGEYSFKVRAIYDDYKGEWYESDDLDVDSDEAEEIKENGASSSVSNTGTSVNNGNTSVSNGPSSTTTGLPSYVVKGTWKTNNGKWMFSDSNGLAYKNKWAAVYNPYANTAAGQQNFDWFYFDGNGYMVTGWVLNSDGHYYYLSPVSDGTQGRMVTGWNQIDGSWYYFNPVSDGTRGAMYVNAWIGNDYVGANGVWDPYKTK